MTEANTQTETKKKPHVVNWLEKRWRMVKGAVKGFFEYLLKPKTYVFAVGLIAASIGFDWFMGKEMMTYGEMGARALQMLTVGTLFHMTIDMIKEGSAADKETQEALGQSPQQQHGVSKEKQKEFGGPHDVALDEAMQLQSGLPQLKPDPNHLPPGLG